MENNEINKRTNPPSLDELIPLSKAAKISGFTRQHLALLIRQGELWGSKIGGRDWYTTEKAVKEYLARGRRPGPKPKNQAEPKNSNT